MNEDQEMVRKLNLRIVQAQILIEEKQSIFYSVSYPSEVHVREKALETLHELGCILKGVTPIKPNFYLREPISVLNGGVGSK